MDSILEVVDLLVLVQMFGPKICRTMQSKTKNDKKIWIRSGFFSGLDIISDAAMGVQLDAQLKNPDSLEYVKNRDEE